MHDRRSSGVSGMDSKLLNSLLGFAGIENATSLFAISMIDDLTCLLLLAFSFVTMAAAVYFLWA
jgi:hypothetical protein